MNISDVSIFKHKNMRFIFPQNAKNMIIKSLINYRGHDKGYNHHRYYRYLANNRHLSRKTLSCNSLVLPWSYVVDLGEKSYVEWSYERLFLATRPWMPRHCRLARQALNHSCSRTFCFHRSRVLLSGCYVIPLQPIYKIRLPS